jgi:hypothetical protein
MITPRTTALPASKFSSHISLHSGWKRIPGVTVHDKSIEIDPDKYFFRYEEPAWYLVDWEKVQSLWGDLNETNEAALEQQCLDVIKREARVTTDPGEVLENAEKMYGFLFSEERLEDPDLSFVTPKHLRALRETSTMMSLNRVARDGRARNVGPAWFFPVCAKVVFDLTETEAEEVDELYHGGFFNESRRVDGVKAHVALGGRLVHGCSSVPNMKGGAVVEYGTNIDGFRKDLGSFADGWMDAIRGWA